VTKAYIDALTWKEGGKTVHGPGSNFYIEPDGTHIEGEYQAAKAHTVFKRAKMRLLFLSATPRDAKRMGRDIAPLRQDWDKIKREIMAGLVLAKFSEHDELREWLLGTGKKLIVENNWWHYQYWGNCFCVRCTKSNGRNELGKILMDVRAELR
jgi:ribA/ribD-fused uncharacterized protein